MPKLVVCPGAKLAKLVDGAKPAGDEQKAIVAVHAKAVSANITNNIITRDDLDALEAMQSAAPTGDQETGDKDPPADDSSSADPASSSKSDGDESAADSGDDAGDGSEDQMTVAMAVRALDPANDDHWNNDGQPNVDAVKSVLGGDTTRAAIKEAAPGFDRAAASAAG